MHNFIPIEIILCDDRDPPWMNNRIKYLIKKKKAIFQKQKESSTVNHDIFSDIILDLSNTISFSDMQLKLMILNQLQKPNGQS